MKLKMLMFGLLMMTALTSLAGGTCQIIQIRVACPNDNTACGIEVCIDGIGCAKTDSSGIARICVPKFGTYTVCVNEATLPPGAKLAPRCQNVKVENEAPPVIDFVLSGEFCGGETPEGECWLTGGGTIFKTKGVANYSFGGVVYPGCSPEAAGGGNWNVVDHFAGLHFQGKQIIVDSCSGVETRSPRVNVNIIDFHGTGTLVGVAGNPQAKIDVSFVGRAVDNLESGGGSDLLFLSVSAGNTVVMQIGTSADDPAVISTGNLQIHTTGCGN